MLAPAFLDLKWWPLSGTADERGHCFFVHGTIVTQRACAEAMRSGSGGERVPPPPFEARDAPRAP